MTESPAKQKYCIATGDEITQSNDSKAHIIPSALGGRLKPRGILCRRGNGILGDKFDQPLIEAFQPLMNLLNGSRDRGQNPSTVMTDESGKKYLFRFGEPLALTAPEYELTETAGVTRITIMRARSRGRRRNCWSGRCSPPASTPPSMAWARR
jgi:HNH endonuclease